MEKGDVNTMNKTYNYTTNKSSRYSYSYSVSREVSLMERLLEILSFIINVIYDFVTDEAVVLVSKLAVVITSFAGIFIMMGMSVCGTLAFLPAFSIALGLLAVILFTFKSMFA